MNALRLKIAWLADVERVGLDLGVVTMGVLMHQ
jgi:hypothetical protein